MEDENKQNKMAVESCRGSQQDKTRGSGLEALASASIYKKEQNRDTAEKFQLETLKDVA